MVDLNTVQNQFKVTYGLNMKDIKKKLTIITITLNAASELANTLNSINMQNRRAEIDLVVVDGLSTDSSVAFVEENQTSIDVYVSEKDRGVYDAMNKGVILSATNWVYFLNAGDVFLSADSLTDILDALDDNDVVYSDVVVEFATKTYQFKTSFEHRVLNHQAFVYRKDLHQNFGMYAVIKGFTAADYLFFLQLDDLKVKKLDTPIAIFKAGGLSSTVKAVQQKYCLDFLSGKRNAIITAFKILLYPVYRKLKFFSFK